MNGAFFSFTQSVKNARFLVEAVNRYPDALEEIQRLRAENERLCGALGEIEKARFSLADGDPCFSLTFSERLKAIARGALNGGGE